jgi:hypothetical protein
LPCGRGRTLFILGSLGQRSRSLTINRICLPFANLYRLVYFVMQTFLVLLENMDFLGFRIIFKVWLNQIFSNFNTMLWTIKYRLSLIMVYFTFTVPELWPFLYARLKTGRIMWLGMAGVHTGFRTITVVLYIRSLPNLATWFPCGRERTLFILGSLGQSHRYYK